MLFIIAEDKVIMVSILEVPSFKKSGELENSLSNFVKAFNGKVIGQYNDNKLDVEVQISNETDAVEFSKKIASFLEENGIEINGASQGFVNGKLKKEEAPKRPTLFW